MAVCMFTVGRGQAWGSVGIGLAEDVLARHLVTVIRGRSVHLETRMFEVANPVTPRYSQQLSDEQLMMMTRAGSSDAFGELVERHHDRLAFYIGQVLGDTESAEDLAQETFLRAYRARARYVPKAKWTTWLRKIARNLYLDERRRRYNTSTQSLDDMRIRVGNTVTFPLYDVLPDLRTPSIETSMVDDEEVDAVRQHIDNLSPKHGQVLKMRVYDEMNYREISDVLGCSLGTVKSRIHYAVRELRSVMAEAAAE